MSVDTGHRVRDREEESEDQGGLNIIERLVGHEEQRVDQSRVVQLLVGVVQRTERGHAGEGLFQGHQGGHRGHENELFLEETRVVVDLLDLTQDRSLGLGCLGPLDSQVQEPVEIHQVRQFLFRFQFREVVAVINSPFPEIQVESEVTLLHLMVQTETAEESLHLLVAGSQVGCQGPETLVLVLGLCVRVVF